MKFSIHKSNGIVDRFRTFPPESGSRHPDPFGSFMIRLQGQSLTCIVSHIVDARVLKCECSKSDSCH